MFLATIAFLAFVAATVQEFRTELEFHSTTRMMLFLSLSLSMFPVFWTEAVLHFWFGSPRKFHTLIACMIPPLRLARRDLVNGNRMWLPVLGWREVNHKLHVEVERALSGPMIVIALMILPLLAIDFVWTEQLAQSRTLQIVVETGYSITWMAFTMEFVVMFSIVKKKIQYLKKHWVDLLIVLLPLVAFLRVMRISQLVRLQQVTKASRVYRIRGLSLRVWRGLLAMDVISRLLQQTPESRIASMQKQIDEKESEIEELRQEIARIESKLEKATTDAKRPIGEGEAA